MPSHSFGGDWTVDKLERVRRYLIAYTTIFTRNTTARLYLKTIYVDAFAGTGYRSDPHQKHRQGQMPLPELLEPDTDKFLKGSARIALEVEPAFNQYLFIERSPRRAKDLENLKLEFPGKESQIKIVEAEANQYLKEWCANEDWRQRRAVLFLDPYGMQVDWSLIETIAGTQAIDLWLLFPLGAAVNRLLTRSELPPKEWASALTRILGTEDWISNFYPRQTVNTLFGEEESRVKDADFQQIGRFFVDRLKSVFAEVSDHPLPLRNSKNTPLYLLCFAAGNPKGAKTAIRIANHILRM